MNQALSETEENYIRKIPEDKKVTIKPFDPHIAEIAEGLISDIKKVAPELEVVHMGASGLGISGQGDLDIYAFASPEEFPNFLDKMISLFDEPKSSKPDSIAWEFGKDGYPIELYLTNPNSETMKKQIRVFNILKESPELLKEYEKLKSEFNGKLFRDYQRKKYEFYHRILGA